MGNQGKRLTFTKPFLLIVEGKDDKNFFEAFLNFLTNKQLNNSIRDRFEIFELKGKQNLTDKLRAIKSTPGFGKLVAIGIILDSNSSPKSTFQSIQTALKKVQLPCPKKEIETEGEKPRVSVLLIPGIERQGELEDLCLESVSNDRALRCLNRYFFCLRKNKIPIAPKESKAKCLAFLASREDLANDIGTAAKKSIWPFENNAFSRIKKFILNLAEQHYD